MRQIQGPGDCRGLEGSTRTDSLWTSAFYETERPSRQQTTVAADELAAAVNPQSQALLETMRPGAGCSSPGLRVSGWRGSGDGWRNDSACSVSSDARLLMSGGEGKNAVWKGRLREDFLGDAKCKDGACLATSQA